MDASADPCRNFHAYVCGGDDDAASTNDALNCCFSSKVLQVLLRRGLEGNYSPRTSLEALIVLDRCAPSSGANEAIEDFVQFVIDRGISWPVRAIQTECDGLLLLFDVLLDVAINWRVVLCVDYSAAYSDIDRSVIITIGQVDAWHRMRQLSTLDDNAYAGLARNMPSLSTNGSLVLDDEDVAKLGRGESVIRSTLQSHITMRPRSALYKVSDVTCVISPAESMVPLKKRLSADCNISLYTVVLLSKES
ncbi:uncharacterized protein [Dermacentor albipictus]|uniref:uncharacterized protein n=1 Tax=Dermacentor albipictus TaxID=60249 RepID=UPI0038FD245B